MARVFISPLLTSLALMAPALGCGEKSCEQDQYQQLYQDWYDLGYQAGFECRRSTSNAFQHNTLAELPQECSGCVTKEAIHQGYCHGAHDAEQDERSCFFAYGHDEGPSCDTDSHEPTEMATLISGWGTYYWDCCDRTHYTPLSAWLDESHCAAE